MPDSIVTQSVNPDELLRATSEVLFEAGAGQLPVEVFQYGNLRWLRFGSAAIQSVMQIDSPPALKLAYLQFMMAPRLFCPEPSTAVLLGLGGGALVRHLLQEFPQLDLTAVECNPLVIEICKKFFNLPAETDQFNVVSTDAFEFVRDYAGPAVDWLLVDLFGAERLPGFMQMPAFYIACRNMLSRYGVLAVNLLISSEDELVALLGRLRQIFDRRILCLQAADHLNVVVLAFASAHEITGPQLRKKANKLAIRSGVDYSRLAETILQANPVQGGNRQM